MKELSATNSTHFQEIQSCQAEVEAGRNELESLRGRTKELEFQLREAEERLFMVEENGPSRDLTVPASRSASPAASRRNSGADLQRLLVESEARSEAKISDLRNKIRALETERNEAEEEWATKLSQSVRDIEKLRRGITEKEGEYAESLRTSKDKDRLLEEAETARKSVEKEMKALAAQVQEAKESIVTATEAEVSVGMTAPFNKLLNKTDIQRAAREELATVQGQIADLQAQLDDSRSHAQTLKANNRTLRDELRKVQSSVQLLEKSRNPGVGYWSSTRGTVGGGVTSPGVEEPRKSLESTRTGESGSVTPALTSENGVKNKEEEEVNLEVSHTSDDHGVADVSISVMSFSNSWSTRRCGPILYAFCLSSCASRLKSFAA